MFRRGFAVVVLMLGSVALALSSGIVVAPRASADPASVLRYPTPASANHWRGAAFETCTAPSLAAMTAWTASPYRAIGVYVAGVSRTCKQPNLTAQWVAAVSALGWHLMPIYLGLQAPCALDTRRAAHPITPTLADSQGTAAAAEAITAMTALGLQPGSIVYADLEHFDQTDVSCRKSVLTYLSAFTRELHRDGYLSGVYFNAVYNGPVLVADYVSTQHARPDAVWGASWDGVRTAQLPAVPKALWSVHQRAKQYLGGHDETYAGVKLNIDTDWLDGPVATVARPQTMTITATARTSPVSVAVGSVAGTVAAGTTVSVLCQAPGRSVGGTRVWDKLSTGSYVSDHDVDTPVKPGYSAVLPRCSYPYQVRSSAGTIERTGPGTSQAEKGTLGAGALAWVVCQKPATDRTGTTKVYDRLDNGWYAGDFDIATPSKTTYSAPIPHC